MKKILAIVFTLVLLTTSLFALAACKEDTDYVTLVYGKKYIHEEDVKEPAKEQRYFTFAEDGTCKYHYYNKSERSNGSVIEVEYITQYRYTFVDEDKSAVVYFYDSVSDFSKITYKDGTSKLLSALTKSELSAIFYSDYLPSTSNSNLLTVSENVLSGAGTYGYYFYINEDYLKTIPHFGEVDETEKDGKEDDINAFIF